MRLSIPDRPGSLGTVASAMGSVGADICSMEIVARLEDRVVDDFTVELPDTALPDALVSVCSGLDGVEVQWIARFPGGSLTSDVEILDELLDHVDDAPHILVESLPTAFHVNWAMIVDPHTRSVLAGNERAPQIQEFPDVVDLIAHQVVDLEPEWLPAWPLTMVAVLPVHPDASLLVARHGGPEFLPSELARIGHLARLGMH